MPERASVEAHFQLLAKPAEAVSNLDYSYCLLLSKEVLYPGSRNGSA